MTIASIDIGSNTVILLIANYDKKNQKLTPILNQYRVPRIGETVNRKKEILEAAKFRLFDVLDEFDGLIKYHKCDLTIINATSAFRIARNAELIKKEIEKKLRYSVNIISGEEEAELTFLGSILPENYFNQVLVIDIGGGSTEISCGENLKNINKKSFPIGILSLYEKFVQHDPPLLEELTQIENYIEKFLSTHLISSPPTSKVFTVAGTPTTLACIIKNQSKYYDELVDNVTLKTSEIESAMNVISKMNSRQILKKYNNVVQGREDLITVGTQILITILNFLSIKEIAVSSRGLRYGAIWNFLIKNNLFTIKQ